MQSFWYHVLSEPQTYKKLNDEIDAAVGSGKIPLTGNVSWAEGQGLAFFQACLKEAMRVRPAVGLNITRLIPPEGAELDGHFFAGGTRIAVNGWVLHRDKPTFGEDADVYRAERWTEDEDRARRMERYMFQVSNLLNPNRRPPSSRVATGPMLTVLYPHSSAAVPTCASGGTWRCWRSTRCCRGC